MEIYDKDIFSMCKVCYHVNARMATAKSSIIQRWVYNCNLNHRPKYGKNCSYFLANEKWRDKPYNRISAKIESFNIQSEVWKDRSQSQAIDIKKGNDIKTNGGKKKMETEGQQKLIPFDGEIKGEIELPKIDVKPYIGKKVKIISAEKMLGTFGPCIQVLTETVETIEGGKRPIELRGSMILGLQQNAEGEYGWGAETKTGLFFKKAKVKSYKDLVGKTVTLQVAARKGIDFLTFTL